MAPIADRIRSEFAGRKIVIVGDLVADQFLKGTIDRVSREAPVFILRHDATETLPGGAANAAANVASLGGEARLIGIVSEDENGRKLIGALNGHRVGIGGVVKTKSRSTTTKVRVLAGQHYAPRQQVIRIDYESSEPIDVELESQVIEHLESYSVEAEAMIISDYGCGVATERVKRVSASIAESRGIPLVIDSRSGLEDFAKATSATPNQEEVEKILGADFKAKDCEGLRKKLGLEALLVTLGNKGMLLVERDNAPLTISAVGSSEPVDVTGAGDTVIAVYTLALAAEFSFADAANLANHAGGIVVMKRGTAAVGIDELEDSLSEYPSEGTVAGPAAG